jgi:glutamate 5-kinase
VVESGCHAFLANGRRVLPHSVFLDESTVGTFFMASHKRLSSRKRWLTFVSSPKGSLVVDAGGIRALKNTHSSLLPVGILSVVHQFDAGDLVNVLDESGNLVARGITKYDSETLRLLLRKKTYEIHALLGDKAPEEVIHKNDLVLLA